MYNVPHVHSDADDSKDAFDLLIPFFLPYPIHPPFFCL